MCEVKSTFAVALNTVLLSPVLMVVMAVNEAEALGLALKGKTLDDIRGATVLRVVEPVGGRLDQTVNMLDAVISHLKEGKKITAIKEVRTATGWGLKKAKEYVDNIQLQHNFY